MAPRSNDNLSQVPFFVIPRRNLIALLRGQLKTNTRILHAVSIPLWTPCTARTQKLVCCKNQPSEIKKKTKNLKTSNLLLSPSRESPTVAVAGREPSNCTTREIRFKALKIRQKPRTHEGTSTVPDCRVKVLPTVRKVGDP